MCVWYRVLYSCSCQSGPSNNEQDLVRCLESISGQTPCPNSRIELLPTGVTCRMHYDMQAAKVIDSQWRRISEARSVQIAEAQELRIIQEQYHHEQLQLLQQQLVVIEPQTLSTQAQPSHWIPNQTIADYLQPPMLLPPPVQAPHFNDYQNQPIGHYPQTPSVPQPLALPQPQVLPPQAPLSNGNLQQSSDPNSYPPPVLWELPVLQEKTFWVYDNQNQPVLGYPEPHFRPQQHVLPEQPSHFGVNQSQPVVTDVRLESQSDEETDEESDEETDEEDAPQQVLNKRPQRKIVRAETFNAQEVRWERPDIPPGQPRHRGICCIGCWVRKVQCEQNSYRPCTQCEQSGELCFYALTCSYPVRKWGPQVEIHQQARALKVIHAGNSQLRIEQKQAPSSNKHPPVTDNPQSHK